MLLDLRRPMMLQALFGYIPSERKRNIHPEYQTILILLCIFQQEFAVSAVKVYDFVVRTSMQPCDAHCIPQLVFK